MRKYGFILLLFILTTHSAVAQVLGTWSNTGPILFPVNVSGQVDGIGRTSQVKFHPSNPMKMYAVSASGGLYISLNNGLTWTPTPGTEQLPTTACSAVCIDFTNDSVLYLSTGDANYYGDDFGIWKSTNGGITWAASNTNIGNRMAVEILMNPLDHNTLVAATDDGIWKTTNGGATWTETWTGGDFRDMKMQPGSNSTLYAVTAMNYYKSTDMGSTWTHITSGIAPPTSNGGMRIAVSPADNTRVYIATTDGFGIIFKSTDAGQTFTNVYSSTTQCLVCYDSTVTSGSQGDYNFDLTANPTNADEVILVSHCVWRSTDAGATWSWRTQWWNQCHTDMHNIEFNPYNPAQLFNANDGGLWLSTDTLATAWQPRSNGLAATEIYHSAQSPRVRQMISIGTQDNGELYFDGTWKCNRGGDWGARCAFDYLPKSTVYYLQDGYRRDLQPLGGDRNYHSPFAAKDSSEIEFVPSMTSVAFLGQDSLWRSMNILPDSPIWVMIHPTNEYIMDINSCRADSNILYVVTNNNHIFRSSNALAANPTFTMLNTPASTFVATSIATNKSDPNIVYLSCGNAVYRSANQGATWTSITYNLPNLNIRKIFHDDYSANERLFVSAGAYVYYKINTMTSWNNYSNAFGLPSVAQVSEFMMYNNGTAASILRLSTYGRGVWECPINYNMAPASVFNSNKQLICPTDTVRYYKSIFGNWTSFSWSFPGGTPSTSTLDSPVVVYNTSGTYNATLTATGPGGSTVNVQTNYIVVSVGTPLAVSENFEGASYPPTGWQLSSQSGNSWTLTNSTSGYGIGSQCIRFDNWDADAGGKHDAIISPKINLVGITNPIVTFDVAYSWYPGYADSLMVQISTDCGRHYTPIYIKDTSALATAPNNTSALFVPTATQWRTDTISLVPYIGQGIMLSFENVGHYGQGLYLDNINIAPTLSVNGVANDNFIQVYPNPAHDKLNITIPQNTVGSRYEITDVIGRIMLSGIITNGNAKIDITTLCHGMYIVAITDNSKTKRAKFIKE
jgi:photosystem II stability/assembly factor-like uncharacterized protein/PKD repeat protein